jgi:hypothetical protein
MDVYTGIFLTAVAAVAACLIDREINCVKRCRHHQLKEGIRAFDI